MPMQCPVDSTTLLLSERQGVEIDYCPDCRGIWLDRGELDKLLQRADDEWDDDDRRRDRDPERDRHSPQQARKKKKKGWLSDMLEFGE
jgi:uncharacterized protein